MRLKFYFPLLLLVLFAGSAHAKPVSTPPESKTDYAALVSRYKSLIQETMKKQNIQGVSLVLLDDQDIIWQEGFGFANAAQNVAASPATLYKVGSLTKVFTASAVMKLQEQNKIDLDAPVKDYLPRFTVRSRFGSLDAVSPRNLMTHHSGLPADIYSGKLSKTPEPFTKVLDQLKESHAAFPAEFVHSYSNVGYSVLGSLVEQVSGNTYADYLGSQVFGPLQMTKTGWDVPGRQPAGLSLAYDQKGQPAEEVFARDLPALSLVSSAAELANFLRCLNADGLYNKQQVLKAETVQEMLRVQNVEVPLDGSFQIGLPWQLIQHPKAGTLAHHTGANEHFRSIIAFAPAQKISIVLLSNSINGEVLWKMAQELTAEAAELKEPGNAVASDGLVPVLIANPSKISETKLAGYYASPSELLQVKTEGQKVILESAGDKAELEKQADGSYQETGKPGATYYFQQEEDRQVLVKYQKDSNSLTVIGEKVKQAPLGKEWQQRLGKYEIANVSTGEQTLFSNLELKLQNDLLVFSFFENGTQQVRNIALVPQSAGKAIQPGIGNEGGYVMQADKTEAGVEELQFFGYRLRRARAN
jgi:CubicO group peptidase (beta-lactamase class C family)